MTGTMQGNAASSRLGDAEVMAGCDIENRGGAPDRATPVGFLASFHARMQRLARLTRRIIGAPDYSGYLAHMKRANPDQIPMTAREFSRQWMEAKYARPGSRCC